MVYRNPICGKYFVEGSLLEKLEKQPFFWMATAGLGKYRMGGYSQIGVYRVEIPRFTQNPNSSMIVFGDSQDIFN